MKLRSNCNEMKLDEETVMLHYMQDVLLIRKKLTDSVAMQRFEHDIYLDLHLFICCAHLNNEDSVVKTNYIL